MDNLDLNDFIETFDSFSGYDSNILNSANDSFADIDFGDLKDHIDIDFNELGDLDNNSKNDQDNSSDQSNEFNLINQISESNLNQENIASINQHNNSSNSDNQINNALDKQINNDLNNQINAVSNLNTQVNNASNLNTQVNNGSYLDNQVNVGSNLNNQINSEYNFVNRNESTVDQQNSKDQLESNKQQIGIDRKNQIQLKQNLDTEIVLNNQNVVNCEPPRKKQKQIQSNQSINKLNTVNTQVQYYLPQQSQLNQIQLNQIQFNQIKQFNFEQQNLNQIHLKQQLIQSSLNHNQLNQTQSSKPFFNHFQLNQTQLNSQNLTQMQLNQVQLNQNQLRQQNINYQNLNQLDQRNSIINQNLNNQNELIKNVGQLKREISSNSLNSNSSSSSYYSNYSPNAQLYDSSMSPPMLYNQHSYCISPTNLQHQQLVTTANLQPPSYIHTIHTSNPQLNSLNMSRQNLIISQNNLKRKFEDQSDNKFINQQKESNQANQLKLAGQLMSNQNNFILSPKSSNSTIINQPRLESSPNNSNAIISQMAKPISKCIPINSSQNVLYHDYAQAKYPSDNQNSPVQLSNYQPNSIQSINSINDNRSPSYVSVYSPTNSSLNHSASIIIPNNSNNIQAIQSPTNNPQFNENLNTINNNQPYHIDLSKFKLANDNDGEDVRGAKDRDLIPIYIFRFSPLLEEEINKSNESNEEIFRMAIEEISEFVLKFVSIHRKTAKKIDDLLGFILGKYSILVEDTGKSGYDHLRRETTKVINDKIKSKRFEQGKLIQNKSKESNLLVGDETSIESNKDTKLKKDKKTVENAKSINKSISNGLPIKAIKVENDEFTNAPINSLVFNSNNLIQIQN